MEQALWSRLDDVLDVPWELVDYERWLREQQPARDDYLFTEPVVRFALAPRDVLRRPADSTIESGKQGLQLASARLGGSVALVGISRAAAERSLALIDGERPFAELCLLAGADRSAFEKLCQLGIGKLLFLPGALAELESRISGTELVRFVGTPYELVRPYWENMADVRALARSSLDAVHEPESALRWLRKLHVVSLLGASLDRFYRPPSRIADSGTRPGSLYLRPTELLQTQTATIILSGPRVGAQPLGGELYQALLFEGDPRALESEREEVDSYGLPWGRLLNARSSTESDARSWFCPPRPLLDEHLQALLGAYSRAVRHAEDQQAELSRRELGRFHYRFVRLHPFRCANQSLCMNLVNLVLERTEGSGIPHLLLDQLALRASEQHYLELFERAVLAYRGQEPTSERWARLRQAKHESYALIERLQRAGSLTAARELCAAAPLARSAALLTP